MQSQSNERLVSYPFVSGDTFRSAADLIFDEDGLNGTFTVGGTVFTTPDASVNLKTVVAESNMISQAASMTLVVHNGDRQLLSDEYESLLSIFSRIASINLPPDLMSERVLPIPLGIENARWKTHGRLEYFDAPWQRSNQIKPAERSHPLLASFRTRTNPRVRIPLENLVKMHTQAWIEPNISEPKYFEMVRNSAFVLSPPGNGADCHRTWEALYLGAIPVLLRGTLPNSLLSGLPVLLVDDWSDFLSLSNRAMFALAEEIQQLSSTRAYMPYWAGQVFGK